MLLARLLGDVLADDLWDPDDKAWLGGRVTQDQRLSLKMKLRATAFTEEQSNLKGRRDLPPERLLVRCARTLRSMLCERSPTDF